MKNHFLHVPNQSNGIQKTKFNFEAENEISSRHYLTNVLYSSHNEMAHVTLFSSFFVKVSLAFISEQPVDPLRLMGRRAHTTALLLSLE